MGECPYQYVRQHRPDIYRRVANVGNAVTCAPPGDDRLSLGARAESLAMEIVADLLREARKPTKEATP